MTTRYRIDSAQSRCSVQAFADGRLYFLGHRLTFNVRIAAVSEVS